MVRFDLTGKKFNSLLVMKLSLKKDTGGRSYWDCLCDCGNSITVEGYSVKIGKVKHCRECGIREMIQKNTTHGLTNSKLYYAWTNMKTRCGNENYDMFKNYGGKGICVCSEWADFLNFKNWALSNGYKDGLTLDRKDNGKGYNPDNCRWSTMKEQQNNRTNNALYTYGGLTLTMKQWSEKLGILYTTLQRRRSNNWPIERLFAKPNYHKSRVLV
jgi:hypothetical protein